MQEMKINLKLKEIGIIMNAAAILFATPGFYPGWESWEREQKAVEHAKSIYDKI